ncbi:hypothetical protein KFK09_017358 [Dendrobium nobile]|uniref:DNA damage-inducible protein 1 n=1 Tax=Dendrobium nobile TaxID=94219 RepID=A0A8T3B157_DENNO|nr:hypothetical protein KFK09_017358 [Dendrobium nobile]
MKITVMTADEQFITLDVDQDESVENVKALLEVETSVTLHQQQLYFNGKEIRNSDRLGSVGVREGDLIMMLLPNAGFNHVNMQNDPELAQAIQGSDLDNLQRILRERHQQKLLLRNKQEEELALMYADPFDVESQRKIEAAIRQRGIDENMEAALEHNPEAFARVVMLYVDMEVNGVPLKAFVDSGAQSTIISKGCAERCGLLRLLDQRYRGVAVGVGQSEILGRIHVAPIKIGHLFFPCSFTVLDAPNMEFLFGLDMLRKHQCIIDLKENVLRLGGGEVSVPFLQEKDIPSHILDEERLKQASLGMGINPGTSEVRENTAGASTRTGSSGTPQTSRALGVDFEAKIAKLVELGFDLEAAKQALRLFNGNEEQAAAYLFGG